MFEVIQSDIEGRISPTEEFDVCEVDAMGKTQGQTEGAFNPGCLARHSSQLQFILQG